MLSFDVTGEVDLTVGYIDGRFADGTFDDLLVLIRDVVHRGGAGFEENIGGRRGAVVGVGFWIDSEKSFFETNIKRVNTRREKDLVKNFKCRTTRYSKSSLPYMAKLLNTQQ